MTWDNYQSRRRNKRIAARIAWMMLGAVIVLITLPYFPAAWASWIGDTQDTITEAVNWGDNPQRSVVIPNDGSVHVKATDLSQARRGDLVEYSDREWVLMNDWNGTEDAEIHWAARNSPWVLAWTTTTASQLASKFNLSYMDSEAVGLLVDNALGNAFASDPLASGPGSGSHVITDAGEGRIFVDASGVEWRLMALREP